MRVTSVSYERTHNLGDFCSVKARVEVQVDEGEDQVLAPGTVLKIFQSDDVASGMTEESLACSDL